MTTKEKKQNSVPIEGFILGLGNIALMFFRAFLNLIHSPLTRIKEFWFFGIAVIALASYRFIYENDHLLALHHASDGIFGYKSIQFLESFSWWHHFIAMNLGLWSILLFALGLFTQFTRSKYANLPQTLGIRRGTGEFPKLKSVNHYNKGSRTSLKYLANGVGVKDFTSKSSQISLALRRKVETIQEDIQNGLIEVILNNAELPSVLKFENVKSYLKKPYSFIVGQGENKLYKQSIRDLPHMLVAGTTSNGKSNFLKNVILGMLHSSERIQLRIIDLKRGVEMQKFRGFNNVVIAKDEREANILLDGLIKEMELRYKYMSKQGISQIDPAKHNMDVFVLVVDEASVLYDYTGLKGTEKTAIQKARNATDTLTKLARAAGIHVIVATQKVTKETVDSRIQGNMGGWMCFKVATDVASRLVLETGAAAKLPKIAGRGVWKVGNELAEVQSPYVDDKCLEKEIARLEEKFNKLYDEQKKFKGKLKEAKSEDNKA